MCRAAAVWPGSVAVAWEARQHLAAYPGFRRRGRALYFYARSSARFLSQPLRADAQALAAAGVPAEAIEQARTILGDALPALAWFEPCARTRTHDPSFGHSLALFGCLPGTFSPSRRQILSTRLWFTLQPRVRSRAVILR